MRALEEVFTDTAVTSSNSAGSASGPGGDLRPSTGIFVSRITKTYKRGKVKALNNLSFEVKPG